MVPRELTVNIRVGIGAFPEDGGARPGRYWGMVIDAYVADLDRALRGPARIKADLVREAADGLHDAAAAYRDEGLEPDEAQRRAVRDFGAVSDVAPDFQAELAAAQGRRTALLICLTLAPQSLVWRYVGGALAEGHRRDAAPGYAVLDAMTSWLGTAAVLATLVAAVACGVGVRYVHDRRLAVLATGYLAYAVAAVFVVTGLLMVVFGPTEALSPAGLPLYAVGLALPMAWVAMSGRRCLRAAPVTPDAGAARSR
jgi:hypothetical protein